MLLAYAEELHFDDLSGFLRTTKILGIPHYKVGFSAGKYVGQQYLLSFRALPKPHKDNRLYVQKIKSQPCLRKKFCSSRVEHARENPLP